MVEEYPEELKGKSTANEKLFKVNESSPKLEIEKAEVFHTTVAKGLFLSKQARPDIQTHPNLQQHFSVRFIVPNRICLFYMYKSHLDTTVSTRRCDPKGSVRFIIPNGLSLACGDSQDS